MSPPCYRSTDPKRTVLVVSLAVLLLGSTYATGSLIQTLEQYSAGNGGVPVSAYIVGVYAGFAGIAGIVFVLLGVQRYNERNLVRDVPRESVQALSVGPSAVSGAVSTEDLETMTAPFSGEECVVARYRIETSHLEFIGTRQGVVQTPFSVDDGTGSVLVEPDDEATYDFDDAGWETVWRGHNDSVPEEIREFDESTATVRSRLVEAMTDDTVRYEENLLREGDDVYVFGSVDRVDRGDVGETRGDRRVIRTVTGNVLREPLFMISEESWERLVELRSGALRLPIVGAVFLGGALLLYLLAFGPVFGLDVPAFESPLLPVLIMFVVILTLAQLRDLV